MPGRVLWRCFHVFCKPPPNSEKYFKRHKIFLQIKLPAPNFEFLWQLCISTGPNIKKLALSFSTVPHFKHFIPFFGGRVALKRIKINWWSLNWIRLWNWRQFIKTKLEKKNQLRLACLGVRRAAETQMVIQRFLDKWTWHSLGWLDIVQSLVTFLCFVAEYNLNLY